MRKQIICQYLEDILTSVTTGIPPKRNDGFQVFVGNDSDSSLELKTSDGQVLHFKSPLNPDEPLKITFSVVGQGFTSLKCLIYEIQNDEHLSLLSDGEIAKELEVWLRERISTMNLSRPEESEVRSLLNKLKTSIVDHSVTLHVPGLVIERSYLDVGIVRFESIGNCRARLKDLAEKRVTQTAHPVDEHPKLVAQFTDWMEHAFPPSGCGATVSVTASVGRSDEIAIAAVREACSLLQIFAWFVGRSDVCVRNVMPREDAISSFAGSIISSETKYHCQFRRVGMNDLFALTEATLAEIKEHLYFNELSLLYAPEAKRNPSAVSIRTCIYWLSKATLATIPSDMLLYSVIATERLLFLPGSQNTKEKWETRLLWLIDSEGLEYKRSVAEITSLAYDSRSRVVHSGVIDVNSNLARDVSDLAFTLLMNYCALHAKQMSQEQILKHLDKKARGLV